MNSFDQRLEHARSFWPVASDAKPEGELRGSLISIGALKKPTERGDVNLVRRPFLNGRFNVIHQPPPDAPEEGVHQRFTSAEMIVHGRVRDVQISCNALDAHAFRTVVV